MREERRMSEKELKDARREARKFKKHLKELTTTVSEYVARIDVLMEQPSTPERGKEIAKLSNALEYANDQARYFGLGIDYRKDAKYKEALERKAREAE